jgi:hypothetical protein
MSVGVDKLKAWMFPALITILATMLWYDIREIKQDVKALMAQSNIDKTRIDNLEREVFEYHRDKPVSSNETPRDPVSKQLVFVRPENYYQKKIFRAYVTSKP